MKEAKRKKKEPSMETLRQKWTGNNTYNNDVVVDYKKKTVKFTPHIIKTAEKLAALVSIQLFVICIAFLAYLIVIPMLVHDMIVYDYAKTFFRDMVIVGYIIITSAGISALWYLLWKYNKHYRTWIYPKVNVVIISTLTRIVSLGTSKAVTVIDFAPEAIVCNRALIPTFSNVELKWESSGDFADYLERINIWHYDLKTDGKWIAVFKFSRKPVNGYLRAWYI